MKGDTTAQDKAIHDALVGFAADPWLAHQALFPHRHPDASPEAHRRAVAVLHSGQPRHVLMAFRGFGKSTLTEEAIVLKSGFRRFHNYLIVGSSYDRACERLAAVKREIEINETLDMFFGNLRGSIWQEGRITLAHGACIQALGRDQSLRGTKYLDWRPDAWLIDDIEDRDDVRTPEARRKTRDWLLKEFLPALADPVMSPGRVLGTPLDMESLVVELEKLGWPTSKFPVRFLDAAGAPQPTWPSRFPLWKVAEIEKDYRRDMQAFRQEYMCEATTRADRTFSAEMIRIEPRAPSWHAVYAMYDPARTVNRNSATTGKAVWSWIGNRLVVWEAAAETWLPDELIADLFATVERFNPVLVGVEEDGLNEWLLQPLRQESLRRGVTIPLRGIRAPKGKLDFIRGLQPFFSAREVVFASAFDDLVDQLVSFPTGRIDAPNALAYALTLRPGAPIYDNFSDENIVEDLAPAANRPVYLAANATGSLTTAVLLQAFEGRIRILADWVREGSPAETVSDIHMEAALEGDTTVERTERVPVPVELILKVPEHRIVLARMPVKWVVSPHHNERYTNVGLVQAVRGVPATVQFGADEGAGRGSLVENLGRVTHGSPGLLVSNRARWTLNAFAGGYCRALTRHGVIADHAEEGPYRVLMEGLESFCALMARGLDRQEQDDETGNFSYDRHGNRYRSAMPARR